MQRTGLEVNQMIGSVSRLIHPREIDLPEEFYPAHLSVALVDAVFRSVPGNDGRVVSGAERYCRRFGLARARSDRWELPPVHEQDSLTDLIHHYDVFGVNRMMNEVFQVGQYFPETNLSTVEYILHAAKALRRLNVEVLQDVRECQAKEIEGVLHCDSGTPDGTARMLLMYTGDDDFVGGDACIRNFVAHAVGRNTVPVARAVKLVRQSAYEMILAPRFLDRQIWRYSIQP